MSGLLRNTFVSMMLVLGLIAMAAGCSGSGQNLPAMPGESGGPDESAQFYAPPADSGRALWGVYTFEVDPGSTDVKVIPNREMEAHFNITSMLTDPTICPLLNCIIVQHTGNQPGSIFNIAVTVRNPTFQVAYDVRGIMVNQAGKHVLTNPDNYTDLWFGTPSPFKAFAKGAPKRQVVPASVYTEDYYIHFPPPFNFQVQYAIDVSWPKNCKEPYWIKDIATEGIMTTERGCAYLTLKCYDWLGADDVESVYVDTYPFTGGLTPLQHVAGTNEWNALILNSFQTTVGEYECLIEALSYDSPLKLYDYVTITVEEPTLDSSYQGAAYNNVTLVPVDEATVTTSDGQVFYTGISDMCGVYEIPDVPEGKRVISFAKPYYQTVHYTTIYEGDPLVMDGYMIPIMADPPPLPVVSINEPFIKWEFGEASVTGTVENLDFPAAVMCHNHDEYLMQVDEFTGEYQYDVQLMPGLNYIRIRATNATGSVFSEEKIVDYGSADYPFKLVLTWDTITDQDLHGWDPNFNHCYYIDQDWPTMFLDIDIIMQGYGPETITGLDVVPGRYYFGVNYYYEHDQSGDTLNTVDVTVNPGTIYVDHQVFQYSLAYGNMNDGYPIYGNTDSWWRVCDIVIDDNFICTIEEPDTSVPLYE